MHCRARTRGFTLLELLVAISILAIIAVIGWRGLDSIVRTRIALVGEMEQMRGMQLAFAQLQSDCAQIAAPGDLPGQQTMVLQGSSLTLVRSVAVEDQPSQFEVVSYRTQNGVLVRRETRATRDLAELDALWQAAVADTDGGAEVRLESDVQEMTLRAWQDGGWTSAVLDARQLAAAEGKSGVGTAASPAALPPAPVVLEVELRLKGAQGGVLKVFMVGSV